MNAYLDEISGDTIPIIYIDDENINQALCVRNFVDICGDAFIKDYAKSVYGVGYISHDDGQVVELMSESYEKFYSVFFCSVTYFC